VGKGVEVGRGSGDRYLGKEAQERARMAKEWEEAAAKGGSKLNLSIKVCAN
jgi:hypothetical protein